MPHNHDLIKRLTKKLKPMSDGQNADAAVALLLRLENQEFKVLLVKRTEKSSDPWSGQMAFPGGKHDPKDVDITQTIIRETMEETRIDLANRCRFLGVLDNMRSIVKPEMLVVPFVILLEYEPTVVLSEELENYVWISLKQLRKHKGIAKLSFGEVPAYLVEEHVVWGLTYRILEKFTQILSL